MSVYSFVRALKYPSLSLRNHDTLYSWNMYSDTFLLGATRTRERKARHNSISDLYRKRRDLRMERKSAMNLCNLSTQEMRMLRGMQDGVLHSTPKPRGRPYLGLQRNLTYVLFNPIFETTYQYIQLTT